MLLAKLGMMQEARTLCASLDEIRTTLRTNTSPAIIDQMLLSAKIACTEGCCSSALLEHARSLWSAVATSGIYRITALPFLIAVVLEQLLSSLQFALQATPASPDYLDAVFVLQHKEEYNGTVCLILFIFFQVTPQI